MLCHLVCITHPHINISIPECKYCLYISYVNDPYYYKYISSLIRTDFPIKQQYNKVTDTITECHYSWFLKNVLPVS